MRIEKDEILEIVEEMSVAFGEILMRHSQLMEAFYEDNLIVRSQDKIEKQRGAIQRERDKIQRLRRAIQKRREAERLRKERERREARREERRS